MHKGTKPSLFLYRILHNEKLTAEESKFSTRLIMLPTNYIYIKVKCLKSIAFFIFGFM